MLLDNMPPRPHFENKYKMNLLTKEDWFEKRAKIPPGVNWFTDGSVVSDGLGACVYRGLSGSSCNIPLGSLLNFFQAKLMTITHCAHNTCEVSDIKVINI